MDTGQGLGPIDFSVVEDFELLPAGRYPGQTKGEWDAKLSSKGDTYNINVKTTFQYERPAVDEDGSPTGESEVKTRPMTARYNTHPDALFRIKRDLINLGADPAVLKSKNVPLQSLCEEFFGGSRPRPVWITVMQRPYKPEGEDEAEMRNEISKIESRTSE